MNCELHTCEPYSEMFSCTPIPVLPAQCFIGKNLDREELTSSFKACLE